MKIRFNDLEVERDEGAAEMPRFRESSPSWLIYDKEFSFVRREG